MSYFDIVTTLRRTGPFWEHLRCVFAAEFKVYIKKNRLVAGAGFEPATLRL